jgi:8-oxo-dGTP pyrophosphatase MutT (NUDIX family)
MDRVNIKQLRKEVSMVLSKTYSLVDLSPIANPKLKKRVAARAIVLHGDEILLIYTKRYNDYTIPGGGVDDEEHIEEGLVRELKEETGAQHIVILKHFGAIHELRPSYRSDYDAVDMISYFFVCAADRELGVARPESYELDNGSEPVWINIYKAIAHNKAVMAKSDSSMGLSIHRETYALEVIAKELVEKEV